MHVIEHYAPMRLYRRQAFEAGLGGLAAVLVAVFDPAGVLRLLLAAGAVALFAHAVWLGFVGRSAAPLFAPSREGLVLLGRPYGWEEIHGLTWQRWPIYRLTFVVRSGTGVSLYPDLLAPSDRAVLTAWLDRLRTPATRTSRPWLTFSLIAVTVLVFLVIEHGYDPAAITGQRLAIEGGILHWPYVRPIDLLAATFLHVSFVHIGTNMLSLYFLGVLVEPELPAWAYLALYLYAGAAGNLASAFLEPLGTVTVGASGAIFGLAGYLIVHWLNHRTPVSRHMTRWLITVIGLNLAFDLFDPQIALWGHLGGLAAGAIFALTADRFTPGSRRQPRTRST